ncbi:MAG: response regulator [Spirochaetes bacterium]|nr:MAG: response regulator [Spirochaetota bacterium]
MSEEPANIYKSPPAGINPRRGTSYEAIIVDDSKMTRQILKQILMSVQFNVIMEIENGATAEMIIRNKNLKPDFMFIDIEMPVMDGITLVKQIRPLLPDCRIVMVTSHSETEMVKELASLGINGFIKKPFDRDAVILRLSKVK